MRDTGKASTTLKLNGRSHHIIHNPSLSNAILSKHRSTIRIESQPPDTLVDVFNFPTAYQRSAREIHGPLQELDQRYLRNDARLASNLSGRIIRGLQTKLPNLVTFMRSPIDQTPWENAAGATLVDPSASSTNALETVTLELPTLIYHFLVHSILPAFMTPAELSEDELTALASDLQVFSRGQPLLALGVPESLGKLYPPLRRALLARKKLLDLLMDISAEQITPLVQGVDLSEEQDASLTIARHKLHRKAKLPASAGASLDLSFISALTTTATSLAFYLMAHIITQTPAFGDQERRPLIERLRIEMAPHLRIKQPEGEGIGVGGIREPPSVEMDCEGLQEECPLLRACLRETARLHSAPMCVSGVEEDCEVPFEREDGSVASKVFKRGEAVEIPLWPHSRDADVYNEPHVWLPERHLAETEAKKSRGSYTEHLEDGSWYHCEKFAEKSVMGFVAGVLAMWEIKPLESKVIKGTIGSSGVRLPEGDFRVFISRRQHMWTDEDEKRKV
ncbi:MAG: hypothetical protein M1828_006361 [Chrysothrix sp. TS-e1954]|nr:MAG: hypothetical protein M1828_006361 [Chrysothrix sp. TS-e1954]